MSEPTDPAVPRGALVVAGLAVAVLFLFVVMMLDVDFAFYLLLFLPRGAIG